MENQIRVDLHKIAEIYLKLKDFLVIRDGQCLYWEPFIEVDERRPTFEEFLKIYNFNPSIERERLLTDYELEMQYRMYQATVAWNQISMFSGAGHQQKGCACHSALGNIFGMM